MAVYNYFKPQAGRGGPMLIASLRVEIFFSQAMPAAEHAESAKSIKHLHT